MSKSKSDDTDGRYSDICGAANRNGEPCGLPAGWGTAGSGGNRCKFHGGASTGPNDTEYLQENDHAEDNAGGGAPALNTNAKTHGACADWKKAYDRLDEDTRAYVDELRDCMRETAKRHAPDVPEERREQLLKEKATRTVLEQRAERDVFTGGSMLDGPGRGLIVTEEETVDGETVEREKVNPALEASVRHAERGREIARELRLWPGFREE